ncbi:MAG: InlB B-repeat-containing protein [Bacilli bacterium]|nr:InlB B-repeat-containing protein [Bacilli bacterium]
MKNKKGFTLIEIIAAVIILGIISIVAVVTYTSSMKEFRDNYYTSLERTLVESGKEFFEDNRSYRPTSIFTAQKVPISILESKAYIDDITDYNGNKCDKSSYVIAIKAAKNDYIYHACLACSEDTYSNLEDKYCDSSWDDPTTVKPDLAAMEDAYVYKNTPQDKLREKLRTAVSITKFDREGNVVDSINGDGVDGIPEILPENIDIVDTSKVGTYTVTYKYNNKSVDRRVHVYENGAPEVTVYKTNVYAKKIVETTVTEETKQTTYSSGQWAQEINIDFQPGSTFYSESGEKVTQYQWSKGGQWKNICDDIQPDGSCHIDYRQEMNEEVAFRVVDNEGNISKETIPLIIRVDKTDPSCSLKVLEGTPGKNDWYNSNIKIGFDVLKDQTSTVTEAKSGIEFNSIRRGTTEYNQSPRTSSLEAVHSDESQYVWYYGFVEDKAQNYARCSIKVRKDSVVPNCSITNHASLKCTDATSKLVKVYFGKTANSGEGDGLDYLSEWTSTGSVPSTGTWYLKATDHSGLTSQISSNYYLVTYDKNGGNSGPTKTSEIKRETELADLTPTARKVAHKMIGWSTSKTATSAITSHTVTKDVTLYAVYQKCGTGYYTDAVGTTCVQCPAGYRDGGPVGAIGDCQKKVTAGYFVDKANDANATVCAKGYYNGEHWVKYGQTSVCTQCPAGYRDGAAAGSQAGCAKSVAANYKVETAYGDASVCSTGYHSSPHTVTYGNISKCTINTYTLTYNNNSGSGCTNKTATHGSAWGKLCTPTRDGYDFKGWYTSASGGTAVTASTTASGNITVYAHWESSCTKVWKCNRETGGPGTYELWLTSCSGDYNYTVTGFKDNVSASSFDTGTIKTYHTGNQYYKCKNASGTCVQSFKYTCEHGNCSSTLYCAQGSCKVVCE